MPKPTSKSRQELRSRFVRNAIPTEADFADLIAASLNQADDGVLKLPEQPLGLVRQKPDQPVLRFFADPAAEGSVWQVQLGAGDKPGFGLAAADGKLALFVDGATGNVGIGTVNPGNKLTVQGNFNESKDPESGILNGGLLALKGNAPQIDFIDTDHGDWAIHVNDGRMYFIREPWEHQDLVLDGKGNIGIGSSVPEAKLNIREITGTLASATKGTLLLDHENAGGASSIVFRSKVNRGSDYGYIEYKEKNPAINDIEAALLTIGNLNDANDHIALMASGNVGIGTTTPVAKLQILHTSQDPNGGAIILGPTDQSNLRLGYNQNYSWIQSHGNKPLAINSIGNRVGIGTDNPLATLHVLGDLLVKGAVVRSIWAGSGNGPNEEGDMGRLNSRTIRINKLFAETALRIVYCDNFRVNGENVACRWEIRVDGNSVSPPILADRYELSGNRHLHGTVMGYARGVAAGAHEIQVWIVAHPHNGGRGTDVCTGWSSSTWSLEAEEVWLA
jgi:hypothetical protein